MRRAFWLACCWLALAVAGVHGAETTKILLVSTAPDHPWASHMYQFDCDVLAQCLRQTRGVEARLAHGWPLPVTELHDVDALVFYSRPAGELLLAPEHRHLFVELMQRGAGFVAIHWATGVGYGPLAETDEFRTAYREVLGGWFRRPPGDVAIGTALLRQVDASHPICRGWQPYEIHDEFYLDAVIDPRAKPLLSVNWQERDQVVGWTFERPGPHDGRSVGITLGHFHHNFQHDVFRRILVNAILWSAHREIPAMGSPVQMDAARLELGPEPQRP